VVSYCVTLGRAFSVTSLRGTRTSLVRRAGRGCRMAAQG
jgi:hypothetical protein